MQETDGCTTSTSAAEHPVHNWITNQTRLPCTLLYMCIRAHTTCLQQSTAFCAHDCSGSGDKTRRHRYRPAQSGQRHRQMHAAALHSVQATVAIAAAHRAHWRRSETAAWRRCCAACAWLAHLPAAASAALPCSLPARLALLAHLMLHQK